MTEDMHGMTENSPDGFIFTNYGEYYKCLGESTGACDIVIPPVFNDKPVSALNDCFRVNQKIRSISLPKDITEIVHDCFSHCKSLAEIKFQEGTRIGKIGKGAFTWTALTKITIPKSCMEIGDKCFYDCDSLAEITFEEGTVLGKIGNRAFESTGISNIIIPKSIEEIGEKCFYACKSLSAVAFKGIGVAKLSAFSFAKTAITTLVVPKSVTEIGNHCFADCKHLSEVVFEKETAVRTLGAYAFSNTGLEKFIVPKSVQEIGAGCFMSCKSLSEIEFEEGTVIKNVAGIPVSWTDPHNLLIPKEAEEIPNAAVCGFVSLENLVFAGETVVKRLGEHSFSRTGVTKFVVPKSVVEIGDYCFASCKSLSELKFEEKATVKKIGNGAFSGTRLREFVVPKSVTELGGEIFWGCRSLTQISFERGTVITSVAGMPIRWTAAHQVVIPKEIEELPDYAFAGFISLATVYMERGTQLKKLGKGTFYRTGVSRIQLPKTVEIIDGHCFLGCDDLHEVVFEEGAVLKKIGRDAFYNSGLGSFTVPDMVEEIGDECFKYCRSLSQFTFQGCVQRLGKRLFNYTRVTSLSLPKDTPQSSRDVLFSDTTGLNKENLEIIETESPELEEDENEKRHMSDYVIDISEYEEIRELGAGGFGRVMLVQKCGELFAAKYIPSNLGIDQDVINREIENLMCLSHPFIVRLHGLSLPCAASGFNHVIMMENVPGGSLQQVMKDQPTWFDDTAKVTILYGVALAMAHVHKKGIIHRDLKPANILLDERHLPRICDFGSSRIYTTEQTMTMAPSFTLYYGAPELYKQEPYDEKVDVYAFAITLYEVITNSFVFRNFGPYQLMNYIAVEQRRATIPETMTEFAKELIEACWDPSPFNRPSFEDICEAFQNHGHELFHGLDKDEIAKCIKNMSDMV